MSDEKRNDRQDQRLRKLEKQVEDLMSSNFVKYAERETFKTYGEKVSVFDKGKTVNKFGRNRVVGSTFETVAEQQGTTANETFVATNIIDSIVSDNAGDTSQTIRIEGHTIDGSGNLTFVVQDAELNGTTEVTLTTPLARANRAYIKASGTFNSTPTTPVGNIYVYDNTDGITSGVPDTAAATKLLIVAGDTQTAKAATSISSLDYWFLAYFSADIGESGASANYVTVRLETRDIANGGAWRPLGRDIVLIPGQTGGFIAYEPYRIVPKNHDIRMRARTDTNTAEVEGEFGGPLALIV